MQTRWVAVLALIVVLAGAMWYVRVYRSAPALVAPAPSGAAFDPKNATYTIEGVSVTLVGGVAEVSAAPGSASMVTTRYFGNNATGDLNGDGKDDTAFLLTQESGGSGVFYYVVAVLHKPTGYQVTNAVLLGDRIAPQATTIRDGKILAHYAERKPSEPMTAEPSVGVTATLAVSADGTLAKIVQ